MKSAYVIALLAFTCFSSPAVAQEGRHYSGTPADRFPGDPVQGGAMKEYQVPPERSTRPHGYGSSYPRYGGDSSTTGVGIDTSMLPPPAPRTELVEQSQNGVKWLCGGIGGQEVSYMKHEASNYDVMLTFAASNGAYLADVTVTIVEQTGHILLHTGCAGPIMLVDLPKGGSYRIRAQHQDHEVERHLQIQDTQAQHRHVVMTWPLAASGVSTGSSIAGDGGDAVEEREER